MPDVPKMKLCLTQTPGDYNHPYIYEPYKLYKDGSLVQEGLTDENGMIEYEFEAPWNSELKITTELRDFTYKPAALNPVDTEEGIKQRMELLGYYEEKDLGNATHGSNLSYEFAQGTQNAGVSGEKDQDLLSVIKLLIP